MLKRTVDFYSEKGWFKINPPTLNKARRFNMIKVYPAIFHLEEDSYWVEFPDFDRCFSDGETLEEALVNAQEALGAQTI